jgi:hypothetical protein
MIKWSRTDLPLSLLLRRGRPDFAQRYDNGVRRCRALPEVMFVANVPPPLVILTKQYDSPRLGRFQDVPIDEKFKEL